MGVRIRKAATAQVKAAADEVEKALDQIVREAKDQVDDRKEQVKASEEYGWWKRLTPQRRFAIGGLAAIAVFLVVTALIRAALAL
jgi:hypothetical protein